MSRQSEIKEEIANYSTKLKTIDDMTTFVLNPERQVMMASIKEAQLECGSIGHNFENGFCIYCGAKE